MSETKDQKAAKPDDQKPKGPEAKQPFFAEAYRYAGGGYIPGVPDHDLTSADLARLSPDVLREVKASPYYTPATDAELGGN